MVDYGWLAIIAWPLFWLLEKFYALSGNWGVAIILLTVLIKIVFFPLSAASYKSMAKMKLITPRLTKLREMYAHDRQKMNQAMMELYKTEKINPLGGCFPILVQIPVFIALYWVLLAAIELRHAPFMLWIKDLSALDPYYVLPILMTATMVLQTRMNPVPPDPVQARVMQIMPFVFSIFFFFFPPAWCSTGWSTTSSPSPSNGRSSACSTATSLPMPSDEVTRDTIAAIATPAGRGGIGVVRLSGPRAPAIARSILGRCPRRGTRATQRVFATRAARRSTRASRCTFRRRTPIPASRCSSCRVTAARW